MSELELLDHLCDLAGIETTFWDLGGTLHHVPEKTRRFLLTAMGYRADSIDALKGGITALEARQWGEVLEPVYVLQQGGASCASIVLREDDCTQRVSWKLEYENGLSAGGELSIDELETEGTHEINGRHYTRYQLTLPEDMACGYHRLILNAGDRRAAAQIILAPETAYQPPAMERQNIWGAAHQLYSLRSSDNWGIGDFSDLAHLGGTVAGTGGSVLGLNPLHALFLSSPERASPYAPSSREFINPLYLDVTAIPEFATCDEAQDLLACDELKVLQQAATIDYAAITKFKIKALRLVFACFEDETIAFLQFIEEGGEKLRLFALYQALETDFNASADIWPSAYRDPHSDETRAFAEKSTHEIQFHIWLQWQIGIQLDRAASHCTEQGLDIGFYGDLAVGVDAYGADAWAGAGAYLKDVTFGAPPDPFSAEGQNWGMPPLDPIKLRDAAYQPFIDILRANMRHAGALRIDHVMWLQRMFWIPQDTPTCEGAYVRYPVDDLFAILALESQRNACMIIGEDLGTVPDGFREKMQAHGILAYRLMRFERYPDGLFKRPSTYPALSLAMFGSHDLPPIAGYWAGRDLDVLAKLGQLDAQAKLLRGRDLEMLTGALRDQQLLPEIENIDAIILAIHRFLARSASALMMVNLEDILGMAEQVNVPGTYLECPNWRHRLNADLREIQSALEVLGPVLAEERARSNTL